MLSFLRCPDNQVLGLPDHFHYLGDDSKAASEERPEFRKVRSAFDIQEDEFQEAANRMLTKVVSEGRVSTAKSGSMMAFDGGLMAKSMSEEEVSAVLAILENYVEHVEKPENKSTLLPRFFGVYVYVKEWGLTGMLDSRKVFIIMANVFANVPPELFDTMEKFDLKGSADDRRQRKPGGEYMGFDLLGRDQKFVPVVAEECNQLLDQIRRDCEFLVTQVMPVTALGLVDYGLLPEQFRGAAGLMDYSLLVGVVPNEVEGGLVRLKVKVQRTTGNEEGTYDVIAEEKTLLLGIIDVLQFWTPKKRIARRFKKAMKMERDEDGEYRGDMLDTVKPEPYRDRFVKFVQELFTCDSWLDSLPRMFGGWDNVIKVLVSELPEPQRQEAQKKMSSPTAKDEASGYEVDDPPVVER